MDQHIATQAGAGLSINSIWRVANEIVAGRLVYLMHGWQLNDSSVLWLIYP
ncbi:hypothetical protein [Puniceibacterium sp. IMCC21224]|uniref:hypothetical protein n=1 Tax=Puniceibacterium sp. IMCC21224 TaxID=1618204 RepID=UPI0012E0A5C3|nr:hypothetical protein [Puniceibacterium sp. IMCC21224]